MEGNSRPIDEFEVGDFVLARSEFDPNGPLELKRVEEKFVRTSVVTELVVHGQSIKTTVEHPFYVPAQNDFVPAGQIKAGDHLISHDDELVHVDAVHSTNEVTTVYNLRVADHHTYFVGGTIWGWDVWVHNANYWNDFQKSTKGVFRSSTEASDAYTGNWTSNSGLFFGQHHVDVSRFRHFHKHTSDIPTRQVPHGVFDGSVKDAVNVLDHGFSRILVGGSDVTYFPSKNAYVIDMGRRIGWQGGISSLPGHGQDANYLRIALHPGTNRLITAFPQVSATI